MTSQAVLPGRQVRKTCAFCGDTFWSVRSDAKYHDAKCRQRALRWRKKMEHLRARLKLNINELAQYLLYEQSRSACAHYMAATIRQIEAELVYHGVQEVA